MLGYFFFGVIFGMAAYVWAGVRHLCIFGDNDLHLLTKIACFAVTFFGYPVVVPAFALFMIGEKVIKKFLPVEVKQDEPVRRRY